MSPNQQKKFLVAAALLAVLLHGAVLYIVGWIGVAGSKRPGKVLIPVTMQIKPPLQTVDKKRAVPPRQMYHRPLRPIKTAHAPIPAGHNKFLARKTATNHGFSVPSGGKVKAGTVLARQGMSETSTSADNLFIPPLPVFNPMPVIPSDLRTRRFATFVRVEFFVNTNATFTSRLLSSTGYDELDRVVLRTLKRWKFSPATLNGQPVTGTLKLRIRFSVD